MTFVFYLGGISISVSVVYWKMVAPIKIEDVISWLFRRSLTMPSEIKKMLTIRRKTRWRSNWVMCLYVSDVAICRVVDIEARTITANYFCLCLESAFVSFLPFSTYCRMTLWSFRVQFIFAFIYSAFSRGLTYVPWKLVVPCAGGIAAETLA